MVCYDGRFFGSDAKRVSYVLEDSFDDVHSLLLSIDPDNKPFIADINSSICS